MNHSTFNYSQIDLLNKSNLTADNIDILRIDELIKTSLDNNDNFNELNNIYLKLWYYRKPTMSNYNTNGLYYSGMVTSIKYSNINAFALSLFFFGQGGADFSVGQPNYQLLIEEAIKFSNLKMFQQLLYNYLKHMNPFSHDYIQLDLNKLKFLAVNNVDILNYINFLWPKNNDKIGPFDYNAKYTEYEVILQNKALIISIIKNKEGYFGCIPNDINNIIVKKL